MLHMRPATLRQIVKTAREVQLADDHWICGIPRKTSVDLINGGNTVDSREHPWNAVIFHWNGTDWEYQCGGTLISDLIVLTARHCTLESGVDPLPIDYIMVKLGLPRLDHDDSNSQWYSASAIYTTDSGFKPNFRNDIALIALDEIVEFTNYILPACLVDEDVKVKETGTIVGFGRTENHKVSNRLRKLSVPIVNPLTCLRRQKEFVEIIDEYQFCAGYTDGQGVCNGDSGAGLLFMRNGTMQVGGIVAYSAPRGHFDYRCKENGYAVYTNMRTRASFLDVAY
ncbi:conserved hypothetical protein [Culex quinquefasciatus]|uniref:Peptidase S1 domain-containing protein n=1 Tax=Culex quinquefasciatus TaxID=7176 RepID=B0XG04_CULQU|nr:conserved hypothetical protein [Culex quinquefasciatus]|eukprot:XP_001868576.1 conserved hypothetical protein [Culex quinquefasciatus]